MFEHWINRRHRKDIVTIVKLILHILDDDGIMADEFDKDLINRIANRVYQDFYGKYRFKDYWETEEKLTKIFREMNIIRSK